MTNWINERYRGNPSRVASSSRVSKDQKEGGGETDNRIKVDSRDEKGIRVKTCVCVCVCVCVRERERERERIRE